MPTQQRGEYTPIQISFDLGSPIHREALFQVLLTMEQEEPEGPTPTQAGECCGHDTCCPSEEVPETYDTPEAASVGGSGAPGLFVDGGYGEVGDDPNG